ncbi:hypothetical protein, partial [Ralstonia pseudosolanacearum]|uniref:hypothetical protein n=1 Tax=Ralstonia pseudosolanacearum TaxID=1310165 RepID=UPI001FFA700B
MSLVDWQKAAIHSEPWRTRVQRIGVPSTRKKAHENDKKKGADMSVTFDLVLPQGCPLAGASETARDAYRVVKTAPPTREDLLTYQELGLLPKANPCKRASVSLFSSYEGAKHRKRVTSAVLTQAMDLKRVREPDQPRPTAGV